MQDTLNFTITIILCSINVIIIINLLETKKYLAVLQKAIAIQIIEYSKLKLKLSELEKSNKEIA